jgi:hypothetical protein
MCISFFVTGGKHSIETGRSALFEKALIVRVHPADGTVEQCVEYVSPPSAVPKCWASILFKSGSIAGDLLYACTTTEILIYQLPGFNVIGYISLAPFNDVHHVCPSPEGTLFIASTGLDMVIEVTLEGKIIREWSVLGGNPWNRFSRLVDYRKIHSTKPHIAHPNYIFCLGKEVWVTRGELKDAVCLTQPNCRIGMDQFVHDGVPYRNMIYFTTVDGRVVIVDQRSLSISEIIDLRAIDNPNDELLGWCRGISVMENGRIWVGFTRIRETYWPDKVNWVKDYAHCVEKPTHVALYDLTRRRRLQEISLRAVGVDAIFSILLEQ